MNEGHCKLLSMKALFSYEPSNLAPIARWKSAWALPGESPKQVFVLPSRIGAILPFELDGKRMPGTPIEVGFNAARVCEAIARIGYEPHTAILDLVDNSVTAGALP